MEIPSTTNPIPPTGETNTSAPLGITSALSTSYTKEALMMKTPSMKMVPKPILLGEFTISAQTPPTTLVYTWSTTNTGLNIYNPANPTNNGFLPWNLIMPYYSNLHNMEYALQFCPYKVADAEVNLFGVFSFDGLAFAMGPKLFANTTHSFKFNDTSDEHIEAIPQFFQHSNLMSKQVRLTGQTVAVPPFIPTTRYELRVMNTYQPMSAAPQDFTVQVFLIVKPNNMQNVSAPRYIKAGLDITPSEQLPTPYFML